VPRLQDVRQDGEDPQFIAQITEPETIAAILKHQGLPTTAPVSEAARREPAEEQEESFEDERIDQEPEEANPRGPPMSR